MSGILRYGVVGAGRVFQRFHLPCVLDRPDLRIVAVCDADPAQARATVGGAAPEALYTADLDEFLTVGRPDVVAVCTPNDAHRVPVLAAVAASAAVLCEKPLAADLADARQIAAGVGDALVGVNLPYRFHPLLDTFVAALDDDEPYEVELTFSTAGQRLWRPVTRWYGDAARAGGGALLDLGSHALDLLVTAFGWPQEVLGCRVDQAGVAVRSGVEVQADGSVQVGVEERVEARLRFARGPATVRIDRASRTMGLRVDARQGDREVTLDLRRHEVRDRGKPILSVEDPRIERAAVARFLAAAADRDGDRATNGVTPGAQVVTTADALRLQELVTTLYAVAVPDPPPR